MRKKVLAEVRPNRSEPALDASALGSVFDAEVAAWARRIGDAPKAVQLRPLKRKWASCSSRGRITFDTALLKQPARKRAEVIVHELLHLKLPNHGRLFQVLYRAYLGLPP